MSYSKCHLSIREMVFQTLAVCYAILKTLTLLYDIFKWRFLIVRDHLNRGFLVVIGFSSYHFLGRHIRSVIQKLLKVFCIKIQGLLVSSLSVGFTANAMYIQRKVKKHRFNLHLRKLKCRQVFYCGISKCSAVSIVRGNRTVTEGSLSIWLFCLNSAYRFY